MLLLPPPVLLGELTSISTMGKALWDAVTKFVINIISLHYLLAQYPLFLFMYIFDGYSYKSDAIGSVIWTTKPSPALYTSSSICSSNNPLSTSLNFSDSVSSRLSILLLISHEASRHTFSRDRHWYGTISYLNILPPPTLSFVSSLGKWLNQNCFFVLGLPFIFLN